MKINYASEKVRVQCSSLKAATKFFGGHKKLAISLLSRVNAIENAEEINGVLFSSLLMRMSSHLTHVILIGSLQS